jgi:hypothetical protein
MSTTVATNQSMSVRPQNNVGTWSFSGSTAPDNYSSLEFVSGSSPEVFVRACSTETSAAFVGLYNVKLGTVGAYDTVHGTTVSPVDGGTYFAKVSGSVSLFGTLITTADSQLCTSSGTETPNIVATALQAGTDEVIVVRVGAQPVA